MTNTFVFIIIAISIVFIVYLSYLLVSFTQPTYKKELQISLADMLKQIEMLYRQKKYEIVENVSIEYLKSQPDATPIREYLAKAFFSRDKIYDAISTILIILESEKDNVPMHVLLAKCYKKINQISKAINEYKLILEMDPENNIAIRELADIYLSQNQKISAMKMFKKYEQYVDSNAELLKVKMTLATLHTDLEEYDEAFEELFAIKEIYPEDIDLNKKIIDLYIKTKRFDEAINLCDELLASAQDDNFSLWLLQNLVNINYALKKYDEALTYAEQMFEHPFADKVSTRALIAKIYILKGEFNKGLDYLLVLAENNPENVEIRKIIAQAYRDEKQYTNAVTTYKEILDLVPPREVALVHSDMSNLYVEWAMDLFDQGEYTECFKLFPLAIQYDETNPAIYLQLGKVNMHIKSYNEAITQLRKSLELNPEQAECYIYLSECYEVIENIYEEKIALLKAIKYDSENAYAHYRLARLYARQRDVENEIASLKKVLQLDPNHIGARHQLALIYEGQGQITDAIEMYESILKLDPENETAKENLEMLKEEN